MATIYSNFINQIIMKMKTVYLLDTQTFEHSVNSQYACSEVRVSMDDVSHVYEIEKKRGIISHRKRQK